MKFLLCLLLIIVPVFRISPVSKGVTSAEALWEQYNEYAKASMALQLDMLDSDEARRSAAVRKMEEALDILDTLLMIQPMDGDAWLEKGYLYSILLTNDFTEDEESIGLQTECYLKALEYASPMRRFEAYYKLAQLIQMPIYLDSIGYDASYTVLHEAYRYYCNGLEIFDSNNILPDDVKDWDHFQTRSYGEYMTTLNDLCYYSAQHQLLDDVFYYYDRITNDPYIDNQSAFVNPYSLRMAATYNVIYSLKQAGLDDIDHYISVFNQLLDGAVNDGYEYSFMLLPGTAKAYLEDVLGQSEQLERLYKQWYVG